MFLLLHGTDEFSAHEELARLRATGGFDFNQDTYSGNDADLTQIRTVCDTLPFLSERRLVVLLGLPKPKRKKGAGDAEDDDDAEGAEGEVDADTVDQPTVASAGRSKKGKTAALGPRAFVKALAEYVPHLPETTTLAVVVNELLEPSHPLVQAAQRHGKARAFSTPEGARLEDWVSRRAEVGGAHIAPDATRLLIESVGADLRLLAGEIEKLCVFVGRDGRIDAEQVRTLTPRISQSSIFDLTDAMARRDRGRALALLHELLDRGESPQAIVALTATQTRNLIQVKAMTERGMRAQQITEATGLHPFVVNKSLPLAQRFTSAQLQAAHRALLDVDVALKSSRMTPELALDLLAMQFGAPNR